MNQFIVIPFGLASCLALASCHPQNQSAATHDHAHDHGHGPEHEQEETMGAEFSDEDGLLLKAPALDAILLKTAIVSTQTIALQLRANARVFHTGHQHPEGRTWPEEGFVHASAIIPKAKLDLLQVGQAVEVEASGSKMAAKLIRLDSQSTAAIGQAEAIFEIPDQNEALKFGTFLNVSYDYGKVEALSIPKSALLDAATGRFVYRKKGERFVRKSVNVGLIGTQYVEILGGLEPGDVVVSSGVVGLWLIELRFTKGGGHSH